MADKIITAEDIAGLRIDDAIKAELYDLKETSEQAGALKALLNSEGWSDLKKAILEDAQVAIFSIIENWKKGETIKLDRSIARLEQLLTLYTTVEGSGSDKKEADELLKTRVEQIVGMMG